MAMYKKVPHDSVNEGVFCYAVNIAKYLLEAKIKDCVLLY